MKVCFVGLGSIGKRHLKNLRSVCKENNILVEVHALRSSDRKLDHEVMQLIDKSFFSIDYIENDYDIVFITNPTSLHYDAIRDFSKKTKNMFIEKPLFSSSNFEIDSLGLNKDGVYYVAAPMRYTNVINKLRDLIDHENIYSVRCICSSYLPNWRNGVDYREVYSAKKSLGGGISLDCIHEWDYLSFLFGFPETIYNFNGKYSHLEIDSDDISIYIARYTDKLIELHLDYIGRETRREIELFTMNGTITADFIKNEIRFTDGRDKIKFENDDDEIYIRELKEFLAMIYENKENTNDIYHAYKVLKLAEGEI